MSALDDPGPCSSPLPPLPAAHLRARGREISLSKKAFFLFFWQNDVCNGPPLLHRRTEYISPDRNLCWARALYGPGFQHTADDAPLGIAGQVCESMVALATAGGDELETIGRNLAASYPLEDARAHALLRAADEMRSEISRLRTDSTQCWALLSAGLLLFTSRQCRTSSRTL